MDFEASLTYDAVLAKFIDFVSFGELTKWYLEDEKMKGFKFTFKMACKNIAQYIAEKYKWEYWGYCVFSKSTGQKFVWWDYAIICFDKGVYLVGKTKQILLEANGSTIDESFYYMLNPDPCDIDTVNNIIKYRCVIKFFF